MASKLMTALSELERAIRNSNEYVTLKKLYDEVIIHQQRDYLITSATFSFNRSKSK